MKWIGVGIMGGSGFIAAALASSEGGSDIAFFVMFAVIAMSFFASVSD